PVGQALHQLSQLPDCIAGFALPYCLPHAVMDKETGSVRPQFTDDPDVQNELDDLRFRDEALNTP
ncbi:MAG: hypothetical protein ACRESV_08890, partial [Nevskiales bacterium]